MRKLALSLFVIAASGAYVWHVRAGADASLDLGTEASGEAPAALPLPTRKAVSILPASPLAPPAPAAPPAMALAADPPLTPDPPVPVAIADPLPVPIPFPSPRRSAAAAAAVVKTAVDQPAALPKGQYRDGTYPGPTVDAYYGLLQVEAVVEGGKLISVDVLQYPADRRTSRAINRQALPMLEQEVIDAQSAHVDIISGATLTSAAYRRSLSRALAAANS